MNDVATTETPAIGDSLAGDASEPIEWNADGGAAALEEPGADVAAPTTEATAVADPAPQAEPGTEPVAEAPMHRAICQHAKCPVWVVYRPTASGHGFAVLERGGVDIDVTFGNGPNGRPTCPRGHGELTLADDQLPAAEAITQVAAQVKDAEQPRRLPFKSPDFNFEGILHKLFEMRIEIKAQEAKVQKSKERAKKDSTELDEMWTKFGEAMDEFKQREDEHRYAQERRAQGLPELDDPRLVRCAWEQRNPKQDCPMCKDALAQRVAPPGSEAHAIEVRDFLLRKELEVCITELATIPILGITVEYLQKLPLDQLAEVQAWSGDVSDHPQERERWMADGVPRGLGRPHVAGSFQDEAGKPHDQHCTICGGRIEANPVDDNPYPVAAMVGTQCHGREKERARTIRRHKGEPPKPTRGDRAAAQTEAPPKRNTRQAPPAKKAAPVAKAGKRAAKKKGR